MKDTAIILAVCYFIATMFCLHASFTIARKTNLMGIGTVITSIISAIMIPILAVSGTFQVCVATLTICNAFAVKYPKFMSNPIIVKAHIGVTIITFSTLAIVGTGLIFSLY